MTNNPKTPDDNLVSKKRNILMDMLQGVLNSPRKESSADLWKIYIDGALDRLDAEISANLITQLEAKTVGNELINLSLQNGKPQQAASYNGFNAGIDAAIEVLRGQHG